MNKKFIFLSVPFLLCLGYNINLHQWASNTATNSNKEIVSYSSNEKMVNDKIKINVPKEEKKLKDDIEISVEKGDSKVKTVGDYSDDESVQTSVEEEWNFQY